MFKFYPASGSLAKATIRDRTIKYSDPTDFNDPFDCLPHFKRTYDLELDHYCAEVLSEIKTGSRKIPAAHPLEIKALKLKIVSLQEKMIKNSKETIRNIGVSCFSKDCKNILMWSHYSESHRGFAIEYEIPMGRSHFGFTKEVNYSENYPMIPFLDYLRMNDHIHYGSQLDDYLEISENFTDASIFTKSIDWKYEKEVRCVMPPKSPTEAGSGFHPVPKDSIKGILIGAKAEKQLKEEITNMKNDYLPNAYIKEARISESAFRVLM